jgi:hypothetical protein
MCNVAVESTIIASAGSGSDVVDVEQGSAPTNLATPTIALQNL